MISPPILNLITLSFLCLLAGTWPVAGASRGEVEASFRAFIEKLRPEAEAQGVPRAVFDRETQGMTSDWTLPDLVPPGTKPDLSKVDQAEFGSPAKYFDPAVLSRRIAAGRAELEKWRKTLAGIERKFGVSQRVLVALWGRESAFGRAAIPHDGVRVLATQAFMGRRPEFFRPELIAALRLIAEGAVTRKDLKSSWAGAMGHVQMLPSQVLKYGVDFDGDGRANIWTSVPDALATAANFLRHEGWKTGMPWGFEVETGSKVDCTFEGPHQGKSFTEWAALGVKRHGGQEWPKAREGEKGFLLMPAGEYGPSFLVTRNFYALKEYNTSDLYALYLGHLADRFADDRPFAASWREVPTYTRGAGKEMQRRLLRHGYNVGEKVDGLIGFRTRVAVGLFQKKAGLLPDCWPRSSLLERLREDD